MLLPRAAIAGVTMTAALSLQSAVADAPPVAAPRTPVTVQELPPVRQTQAAAAQPAIVRTQPPPVPVERPIWRQPFLYALIALADTLAASFTTILYLRKPSKGVIRLAAALTGVQRRFHRRSGGRMVAVMAPDEADVDRLAAMIDQSSKAVGLYRRRYFHGVGHSRFPQSRRNLGSHAADLV